MKILTYFCNPLPFNLHPGGAQTLKNTMFFTSLAPSNLEKVLKNIAFYNIFSPPEAKNAIPRGLGGGLGSSIQVKMSRICKSGHSAAE